MMDIIIVCHTEFGKVVNKKVIAFKDYEGFTENVLELSSISNHYGAKITFAVCPETIQCFPLHLECEVGLHVHAGWEIFKTEGYRYIVGDIYLKNHCKQSLTTTVLRDYSYEEQLGMIQTGKQRIIEVLGKTPKVFVAGRWSINNNTVKALVNEGFTHDCSAMAHHRLNWFDWSKLPRICLPYHPSTYDYQVPYEENPLPLLIVPISQMSKGGNVNPETSRLYGLTWLKLCFKEYYLRKVPLFHICLHLPCISDNYYKKVFSELLSYIAGHKGIEFKYVSEIRKYE